eukprot:COSAG05_NODE_6181_length_1006_cov_1.113561_2_plen_85_part_00
MASSQEAMLSKQRALEEELEKERAERRALESRVHALEERSSAETTRSDAMVLKSEMTQAELRCVTAGYRATNTHSWMVAVLTGC